MRLTAIRSRCWTSARSSCTWARAYRFGRQRFVGKSLRTLDLRTRRGITIVSIQRGSRKINIPHSDDILLPADRIAVVGTDAELKRFAAEVEVEPAAPTSGVDEVVMRRFR